MLHAGAAQTNLTPFWGVELAGWGYYLKRTWREIADPIHATAFAFEQDGVAAIIVVLDLMVANESFVAATRRRIRKSIGAADAAVMICCTHTHSAPACGGLLGVGETDPAYQAYAEAQAATAAILAWRQRRPAQTAHAATTVSGLQFNRTRSGGVYDDHLTVLRVDGVDGRPIGALVNFAGHPTVETELQPYAVSGDLPGRICRGVEAVEPGRVTAYLQGACGDVNFLREFQTPSRRLEPAQRLTQETRNLLQQCQPDGAPCVRVAESEVELPTRRWSREEIAADRDEAALRLERRDATGWRETIGRSMTNRPDDMVKRHGDDEWAAVEAMCRFNLAWTEQALKDLEQRDLNLRTSVQAIRIGNWHCVSNASEFFSPFALHIRRQFDHPLAIACYANGRIGYLPDGYDIERKSYAGWQSPKYCNQFPFVNESGDVMTAAMLDALRQVRSDETHTNQPSV